MELSNHMYFQYRTDISLFSTIMVLESFGLCFLIFSVSCGYLPALLSVFYFLNEGGWGEEGRRILLRGAPFGCLWFCG